MIPLAVTARTSENAEGPRASPDSLSAEAHSGRHADVGTLFHIVEVNGDSSALPWCALPRSSSSLTYSKQARWLRAREGAAWPRCGR